jgi:hypothetical protein
MSLCKDRRHKDLKGSKRDWPTESTKASEIENLFDGWSFKYKTSYQFFMNEISILND